MRVGQGHDLHRLVAGRPLKLGGIVVPSAFGSQAHSDGDCLLHALIDALLGAAALGDIGGHFPPADPRWRDADSAELLATVLRLLDSHGWRVENVDSTILLERPRLAPYVDAIRRRLAELMALSLDRISVKAKTNEGLGEVGDGRAIAADVVVLIERKAD